jgi:hypothetical protein
MVVMALIEAAAGTRSQPAQRAPSESAQQTSFSPPARTREVAFPQINEPGRIPLATEPSSGQAAALKSALPESETPPLLQAGVRAVKAVIGDNIGQGNYIVHCYPPASPKLDIRLPEVVIPSDLRAYGRPVFVSIDVQNGIRRPVITPREITEPLPRLPEQDAIESWLTSLEC